MRFMNHARNDLVLSLDNIYVIYLMEKNGGGLIYDAYGHMIEYHHTRKTASKLQCNFEWTCARISKQNKK